MDVKIKGFFEKVKDFFKKMSKKMRIVLGVTTAVLIIGIVAFVIWANNKPYETLMTGLPNSEMSSALSFLSENGYTDYKVQGDSILVPADQVSRLQGQMALAGYPKNGFLFDIYFDKINSLSTTTEADRAWLVGLEEKIRSVLCTLDGIRDATVDITLGKERSYILEDNVTESSAAITLTLDGSTQLSSQMVNAIAGIVAHAVEGLTIDNVFITDQYYNSYTAGDTISSISEASALKVKLEQDTSNNVRSQVLQVLGSIYGQDNVKVAVNCNVDVSRKIVEDTQYSQPTGAPDDGGGLIDSQTWFWQVAKGDIATTGGVVGTPSNSEIPNYMNNGELDGDEDYAAYQGSNERDNNKRVEQSEVLAGTITDIGIAVTIAPKYQHYLTEKYWQGNSFLYTLMPLGCFLFTLPLLRRTRRDQSSPVLPNSVFYALLLQLFITRHFILERLSVYAAMFSLLALPAAAAVSGKQVSAKLRTGILILGGLAYLLFAASQGFHGVYPYHGIWDRALTP